MPPRIAIPMPHSADTEYAERSIPQYEKAIELAGGEPVRIPLDRTAEEVIKLIEQCDAALLPGSGADVDPARYDGPRHPRTAPPDSKRDIVDELLLKDAYNLRKPILGICYGLQSLNVQRRGTLLQHIESKIKHDAGRAVPVAHTVKIDLDSRLGKIVDRRSFRDASSQPPKLSAPDAGEGGNVPNLDAATLSGLIIPVNSSHHQAAESVGQGLRVVARCPEDGVIEAIEGTSPDHFVLAVQWHPERSTDDDAASRAIFRALVDAVSERMHKSRSV
ncbi:MAG: gamma-glutamyl-gamma-aminobutyrate hydrolase family protein [Terriglobales bacterium]